MRSLRIWHIIVFAVALIAFGVARAPASLLAREARGAFTYARAEGTIWDGRLEGVRLAGLDAGALVWKVRLADLVQGKFVASFGADGAQVKGQGLYLANYHGHRRIVVETATITGAPLAPGLALAGETSISGLDIFFGDKGCEAARGALRSDVLEKNSTVLRWTGPQLSGAATCEGEDARVALEGAQNNEIVSIVALLRPNGDGQWSATARTDSEEARLGLAAAGLSLDPATGAVAMTREFRWAPF